MKKYFWLVLVSFSLIKASDQPQHKDNHSIATNVIKEMAPAAMGALPLGKAAEALYVASEAVKNLDHSLEHHQDTEKAVAYAASETGVTMGAESLLTSAFETGAIVAEESLAVGLAEGAFSGLRHGVAAAAVIAASNVADMVADHIDKKLEQNPDHKDKEVLEVVSEDLHTIAIPGKVIHYASGKLVDGVDAVGKAAIPKASKIYSDDEWQEYHGESGNRYWTTRSGRITNIDPYEPDPTPEEVCRARFGDQADIVLKNAPEICGAKPKSETEYKPSPGEVRHGPLPGTRSHAKMQQQFEKMQAQEKARGTASFSPTMYEVLRNLEPKNKIPTPSAESLKNAQTLDDVARHPAVPNANSNSNTSSGTRTTRRVLSDAKASSLPRPYASVLGRGPHAPINTHQYPKTYMDIREEGLDTPSRERARNLFRDATVKTSTQKPPVRPTVNRATADAVTDRLNRAAAQETELKFQQQQKAQPANLQDAAQKLNAATAKYKVDLSQARHKAPVEFADPATAELAQTFVDVTSGIGDVVGGRKGQIITGIADNFVKIAANMEKASAVVTKLQNAGADQSLSAVMGTATGAAAAVAMATPFACVLVAGFAIINLMQTLDADDDGNKAFETILQAIQQAVEIITTQIARFEKNVMNRFDGIEKFLTAHHRIMMHAFNELKLDASDIKLEIANVHKKIQEGHAALVGQVASNQHMLGTIYDLSHYGFSDQVSREIQSEVDKARIAMEQSSSDEKLNKRKAALANSAISNAKQALVTGESTNIEDPVLASRDLESATNASSVVNLLRKYLNKNFALSFAAVLPNPLLWSACANMYNEILCKQTLYSADFPNESTASIDQLQLQKLITEGEQLESFINKVHSNGLVPKLLDQYKSNIQRVKSLLSQEKNKYQAEKVAEIKTRLKQKLERETLEIDKATDLKCEEFDRQIDIAQKHAEKYYPIYAMHCGDHELRMVSWRGVPKINLAFEACKIHPACGGQIEAQQLKHLRLHGPKEIRNAVFREAHNQLEPKHKELEELKQNMLKQIALHLQEAQKNIAEVTPKTLFAAKQETKQSYYLPNVFVFSRNKGLPPLRWPIGLKADHETVQMYERGEIDLKFEYEIKDDFFYVYSSMIEQHQYGDVKVTELQTFKISWTGTNITPEEIQNFWEGGCYAQKQDRMIYYGHPRSAREIDYLPNDKKHSFYPPITPYKPIRENLDSAAIEKTDNLAALKSKMKQLAKQSNINLHGGLFKRILEQMQPSNASALYKAAKEMDYKYFALVNLIRLLYGQDKVYDFMHDRTNLTAPSRLRYMRTAADIQTVFQRNINENIVMDNGLKESDLSSMTNYYAEEAKKQLPATANFSEHAVLETLKLSKATYPQIKIRNATRPMEIRTPEDILELRKSQDQLRGELGELRTEFKLFSSDMSSNMALMLQLLQQKGRRHRQRVVSAAQASAVVHESDSDDDTSDSSEMSRHSTRQRVTVHNADSDSDNDYEFA